MFLHSLDFQGHQDYTQVLIQGMVQCHLRLSTILLRLKLMANGTSFEIGQIYNLRKIEKELGSPI